MRIFANAQDFQTALAGVIRQASRPNPSRHALAAELDAVAQKLGAGKAKAPKAPKAPASRSRKKKPAEEPRVWGRQELVNIAHQEADKLSYLKMTLEGSAFDVKKEMEYIQEGIAIRKDEAKLDDKELPKADIDEMWAADGYFAGRVLDAIIKAVDYLAGMLEEHERITQETELAKAVRDFQKKIPDGGSWPEGKGEKHFNDVIKAFNSAAAKVPTGLSKPSELTKLRDAFEGIADVVKLMTGKSISVPKIPKALDPEDPRQLGFGFSASARIADAEQLKDALYVVYRMASVPNPSRAHLAEASIAIAGALRR
jgi:hypothetical protein